MVVCVIDPEVPVIVIVDEAIGVDVAAVNVKVLYPVVGFGLKDAVTPLGRPDAARLTLPANPYCGFTSM